MVAVLALVTSALAGSTVTNIGWAFRSVYVVRGSDGIVLVDAHNPDREDRILRRLAHAGFDPDDVTLVVATHGHPDHAGSTAALAARLDVPVAAGAADIPYLSAGVVPLHPTGTAGRIAGLLVKTRFPPVTVDLAVTDRLDLGPWGVDGELRVVGGHTPGSLVVDLRDGQVISGDLIRSGLVRHHTPRLHFFHDDEPGADAALGALVTGGATTLWPSHGGALAADDVADWLVRTGHPADGGEAVASP